MDQVKPPREDLFRATLAPPTLERAEGDTGMPTMTVEFARFGEWTLIDSIFEGRFLERVAPTALDKTIAESRDQMRVLFNHGKDPQIGDKVLGPITSLGTTPTGARGEVALLDTSYNRDLVPGLEAGLYGASFRFQVMQEDFVAKPERSDHNPDGTPERTILEARVREWGPVTFGAYPNANAGLRSLTDEFLLGRFVDDPDRLLELVEALRKRQQLAEAWKPVLDNASTGATDPSITTVTLNLDGRVVAKELTKHNDRAVEPEPSEATTQTPEKPERSVATTFRATGHHTGGLFTTTRKEKPQWRL